MNNIEILREQMVRTAEQHGSFTHPEVVSISQQLDTLINQVQRQQFRLIKRHIACRRFIVLLSTYQFRLSRLNHQSA